MEFVEAKREETSVSKDRDVLRSLDVNNSINDQLYHENNRCSFLRWASEMVVIDIQKGNCSDGLKYFDIVLFLCLSTEKKKTKQSIN